MAVTAAVSAAPAKGGLLRSFFAQCVIWSLTIILGGLATLFSPFTRGQVVFWLGRLWSYLNMKASGAKLVVEGRELVHEHQPQILIGNHTSNFDIFAVILALKGVYYRFLVKREALFLPFFGWALWAGGFPFLDRQHGHRAIRTMSHVAKRIQKSGMSIVGFPEGTRNTTPDLLPFKKGSFVVAIELGAPVIPFVIRGAKAVQGRHAFRINPGTIKIVFYPPIPTQGLAYTDRDALIAQVREVIEKGLRTED